MSEVIWARIIAIQIGVKQELRHPYSFSLQIKVCIIYDMFIKTLPDQQKTVTCSLSFALCLALTVRVII